MEAHPPALAIAARGSHLGTLYGTEGNFGCVFSRFVWQRDQPLSDPSYVFPIVDYIQRHYRVDRTIGDWVLLKPVDASIEKSAWSGTGLPTQASDGACNRPTHAGANGHHRRRRPAGLTRCLSFWNPPGIAPMVLERSD